SGRYIVQDYSVAALSPDSGVESWTNGDSMSGAAFGVSASFRDLKALTFVPDELKAVVRQGDESVGAIPGRRWLDSQFTATALRDALLDGPSIVHFATHF